MERLVVVGGGQASAQLVEAARQEGFKGAITLVSEEPAPPYGRPPLSKQFLAGEHRPDWLLYRPLDFYARNGVELCLGSRAIRLDRDARVVILEGGEELSYDRLALATGSRARDLPGPGGVGPRVFSIRTLADVERLRPFLAQAAEVAVVGGGFIGLEAAAVLVQLGHRVTLLAQGNRLLPRLGMDALSRFLLDQHEARGVRILFETEVVRIEDVLDGVVVVLAAGYRLSAHVVLVGIGAIPNTALASEAGLDCDDGIVVDQFARTSDPLVVAAGYCTNHPSGPMARRARLETVHNAVEQGRTAGATVAGKEMPYIQVPWVWSDQYGFRIQSVGVSTGCDRIVLRGNVERGSFASFGFRNDQLMSVTTVNRPAIFAATRRLLNERIPLTPAEAADPTFDIATLPGKRRPLDFDTPWPNFKDGGGRIVHWGHS